MLKLSEFKGISIELLRHFAIQILQALNHLHKCRIIHCDLKPENIVLKEDNKTELKIIDLGSACFETDKLYSYIQSRYYRSPEVIFGNYYNTSIDMWSFGCILFELFTGTVLFKGESEDEQIAIFMEHLGLPPKYIIDKACQETDFFDSNRNPILRPNSKGVIHEPGSKNIREKINCDNKDFINLIERCLEWDPKKRITAEEALRHRWFISSSSSDVRFTKRTKYNRGFGNQYTNDETPKARFSGNEHRKPYGNCSIRRKRLSFIMSNCSNPRSSLITEPRQTHKPSKLATSFQEMHDQILVFLKQQLD